MHVQSATRLAHSDFWSECDCDAVLVCQLTHNPLGYGELVGSVFYVCWQKLYFVLLIYLSVFGEIAHLGMSVFDEATGLSYEAHGLNTIVGKLVERGTLMVSALVGHLVHLLIVGNDVVLKFAHGLHAESGCLGKHLAGLAEYVLRRALKRLSLTVVEGAEDVDCWNLSERVSECSLELRHHVKVALSGFDKREKA